MQGNRIKILVEVDTDQVPGWGYDPMDYVNLIQRNLDDQIPHYNPAVQLLDEPSKEAQEVERAQATFDTF